MNERNKGTQDPQANSFPTSAADDLPRDWLEPKWSRDLVHNWHNYIPDALKSRWLTLSEETRMVAACMAEQQANREEWD